MSDNLDGFLAISGVNLATDIILPVAGDSFDTTIQRFEIVRVSIKVFSGPIVGFLVDKFAGLLRLIAEASMQTIKLFQEHKHSNSRCKGGSSDTRDTRCSYLYNDDYCLVRYNDIIQNVDLHGTTIIGNFTAWSDAAARCSIMVTIA